MAVSEAPQPSDILWDNMYISRTENLFRRVVGELVVGLTTVVYIAPVTLLSFVTSASAIRSHSHLLDRWCHRSTLVLSLVELVQPTALVLLMDLLPPLLGLLSAYEGYVAMSRIQMVVFSRCVGDGVS